MAVGCPQHGEVSQLRRLGRSRYAAGSTTEGLVRKRYAASMTAAPVTRGTSGLERIVRVENSEPGKDRCGELDTQTRN
jgi:hypothetical protein